MTQSYLLDIDFYVLLEVVAVEVQDEIVHIVEAVAHYNQRELVSQLGLLPTVKSWERKTMHTSIKHNLTANSQYSTRNSWFCFHLFF